MRTSYVNRMFYRRKTCVALFAMYTECLPMYISCDSLLFPTPASFVALHTYIPSSSSIKPMIVSAGQSTVPPEYRHFSCTGTIAFTFPSCFVHSMVNGDGLPDILHSIVWLNPDNTFVCAAPISSFSFSKIE